MQRARWPTIGKRILELLLAGLFATLLIAAVFGRLIPLTGRTTLVVQGPSMEPAIPIGAAIVASPVDAALLRVGDVVSMQIGPARSIFTHRIDRIVVRAGAVWIGTRGDANKDPDPALVPATEVIGRVDLVVPALGYLLALLSTVSGVALVFSLTGLLLVGRAFVASFQPTETTPLPSRSQVLVGRETSVRP